MSVDVPANVPAAPAAPAAPPVDPPVNAPAAPVENAPAVPVDVPADPPANDAPKWDGDFDADRAARLVANLRAEVADYKTKFSAANEKITAFEQAQMTDIEKASKRAEDAETALREMTRRAAVADALRKHGLSDDDAEWLTGDTAEEIDARAARVAERMGSKPTPGKSAGVPPTLPIPGNGGEPAGTNQLTLEEFNALSPRARMEAYRAGRARDIGGR